MESTWSGDSENSFFSSEIFDRHRVLLLPEYEASGKNGKNTFYVLGVDVGRLKCTTEIVVIKVTPQTRGSSLKTVVNIYTFDAQHFEEQAIQIKKLFYKYKAQIVVIDANGMGVGLVDYMVKSQIDPETGDVLPPFGVENDKDNNYKQFRTPDTEIDAMYLIKAQAPLNTEAHTYVQTQMGSGKLKFLIDENQAKIKLMSTKKGQAMDSDQRAEYLKPFTLTTILKEQMMNLTEENEGVNIILKRATKTIKSDKFSALEYAMYWIKQDEDRRRRRKKINVEQMMFFS